MSNYFSGTVNPNIKGGSSTVDDRRGLGIGDISNNNPAGGLGKTWDMGPIYSPKGEWDDFDEDYYDDDDGDIEDFDMKLYRKSSKSFNVTPTDSMRHKGNPIGYMGGLGAIALRAGKNVEGQIIIEDYVREVIKEISSMSGNINFQSKEQAKNTGSKSRKVYKVDKTTSHTNKIDNSPNQKSSFINSKGYGNSARTPSNLEPYVEPGHPADADGVNYMSARERRQKFDQNKDEVEFNKGEKTSSEVIFDNLDEENKDISSFLFKNKY